MPLSRRPATDPDFLLSHLLRRIRDRVGLLDDRVERGQQPGALLRRPHALQRHSLVRALSGRVGIRPFAATRLLLIALVVGLLALFGAATSAGSRTQTSKRALT